jgi:hypothetical protein
MNQLVNPPINVCSKPIIVEQLAHNQGTRELLSQLQQDCFTLQQ